MPDTSNQQITNDISGEQLGDYRLIRRLGYGGMADVYLAVQTSLKRNVALKILKPDLATDKSYVERFYREAQSVATIVHSNIVQIFEVNQANGYHFIAQEYVRGRNLKQFLARNGAIEASLAMSILRQCAAAIQKADQFDIVHRDIKPENIMLTSDGEAKITDFGLARKRTQSADASLTQSGMTLGTPLYMSPEQVEGRELDVRSDIYSLGVTMYHMLAGHPPFDGDSPLAIAVKQVKNEATPLFETRPDVPAELCQVIEQLMAKEQADRPQNAMEVLKLLQPIQVDSGSFGTTQDLYPQGQFNTSSGNISIDRSWESTRSMPIARQNPWLKRLVMAVAAGLLVGVGLWGGYEIANRVQNAETAVESLEMSVPKKDSASEQYASAYWSTLEKPSADFDEREAWWQAVQKYFPLDEVDDQAITKLYHQRAQCRLGEIYLESKRLDEAETVYKELTTQQDLSPMFQTTGLAGQAVTLSYRNLDHFDGGADEKDNLIRGLLREMIDNIGQLNSFMRREVDRLLILYPGIGQLNELNIERRSRRYPVI